MPTTELVVLKLKPDSNIGDPDNAAAQVLKKSCDILKSTPGCEDVHFGTVLDEPLVLRLLIDWESLPKHKEFMASSEYQPFLGGIRSIVAGPPQIVHVDFQPAGLLHKALSAHVTEILSFQFSGDLPTDYVQHLNNNRAKFDQFEGIQGFAWGETYETSEYEGVTGKTAVIVAGWTSIEAQRAAGQSELFKEMGPILKSTSEAGSMKLFQAMKYLG